MSRPSHMNCLMLASNSDDAVVAVAFHGLGMIDLAIFIFEENTFYETLMSLV